MATAVEATPLYLQNNHNFHIRPVYVSDCLVLEALEALGALSRSISVAQEQ
jgi:hypothetical protein